MVVVDRYPIAQSICITHCAPAHVRTHARTHIYARTCTHMHTHAHTCTYAHAQHVRDGETARVSLNDQVCWTKTGITTNEGTQQCGHFQPKNEKAYPVFGCSIKLQGFGDKPLTIRVWTDLDEPKSDESFGIDNVVIRRDRDTTTPPSA